MSDKRFNSVKAVGDYVTLKVEKVEQDSWKQKNSGLYVPGSVNQTSPAQDSQYRIEFFIDSIGDKVENPEFKVGDKVVIDHQRALSISDDDDEENIWAIVKSDDIKAVLG